MCSRNTLLTKERRSGQSGVILALDQFTGIVFCTVPPQKRSSGPLWAGLSWCRDGSPLVMRANVLLPNR